MKVLLRSFNTLLVCCHFLKFVLEDILFLFKRPLLYFRSLKTWPQTDVSFLQLFLGLSPSSLHPSPPNSAPWPLKHHPRSLATFTWKHFTLAPLLFTSALRLLFHETSSTGLHLSGPNGNHSFSNTSGLSWTDKVKTCSGQCLWLVQFLFTVWVLGLFSSAGKFLFPVLHHHCNSARLYFTVCVCAGMTMSSFSPLMCLWAFSSVKGAQDSSNIHLSASTSKAEET